MPRQIHYSSSFLAFKMAAVVHTGSELKLVKMLIKMATTTLLDLTLLELSKQFYTYESVE